MLVLYNEAVNQGKRDSELKNVLDFLKNADKSDNDNKSLYIKCLIMEGQLEPVIDLAKDALGVGWSYGPNVGLVFGAVVAAVAESPENAQIIQDIIRSYSDNHYGHLFTINTESDGLTFYDEISSLEKLWNGEIV